MRLPHSGTISRLCACRRDHSDARRRHRERARHCGGAAAVLVARRATEWHEFAVPALAARGRLHSFLAWWVYTAHHVQITGLTSRGALPPVRGPQRAFLARWGGRYQGAEPLGWLGA